MSEGTNIIVEGLDLQRGDEIVITDHNQPSNNDAWKVRARRHGLIVKSVPVSIPAKSKNDLIAGFDKVISPKTIGSIAICLRCVVSRASELRPPDPRLPDATPI